MRSRPGTVPAVRVTAAFLSVMALLGLGACVDDGDPSPSSPNLVLALAIDADTGAPQPGVKLVLVSADSNLVEAGPVVTGAGGRALLGEVSAGRHAILAFPADGRGVYQLPPPFTADAAVGRKDDRDRHVPAGPLAPAAAATAALGHPAAPDTLVLTVLTWVRPQYADVLGRITGRVIDAVTREPLSGAFVSGPSHLSLWQGRYSVRDDVTLADGGFHVADIPFAPDPVSGNLRQMVPLVVAREGYRPRLWRHEPRHGDDDLDIAGVAIALAPLDGTETGALGGVVTRRGEPAAGIAVGIALVAEADKAAAGTDAPSNKAAAPAPDDAPTWPAPLGSRGLDGQVAVTAADGSYRFTGLARGWYVLHPGFAPDDDAVFPGQAGDVPVLVSAGGEAAAETLAVLDAIHLLDPPHGAVVTDTLRALAWTAVAGADSYLVRLDGVTRGPVARPSLALPEGETLAPGHHAWDVVGFRDRGDWLGVSETTARFRVVVGE